MKKIVADEEKLRTYLDFMYNADNIGKCSICPEKKRNYDKSEQLPCGQYQCWVSVHLANKR